MATPVVSVRAAPAAARIVRLVAKALRERPALGRKIRALIKAVDVDESGLARPDGSVDARPNIGPFRNETETLAALVGRLVAKLRPDAVYLFGSRAQGGARPDSDYDLAVVLRDDWSADPLDYDAAYEPLLGLGVGCDVVPYPRSVFAIERDLEGTIAFAAVHRGRLLYEAPRVRS